MNSPHTKYGIEALTDRLGRSGLSLLTVAVVCIVVVGTVSMPVAGDETETVDEPEMAYVDGGDVHIVDADGNTKNTGVSAAIIGPPADIDDDDAVEVPFVKSGGTLGLVEPDGNKTELANNARAQETAITLGDCNNGSRGVIYVDKDKYINCVEPDGSSKRVDDEAQAYGVIGYGDYDGDDDGKKEVVYVGDSYTIKYIDDGSIEETSTDTDSDNGLGAGPLGDFNKDGNKRAAVVDDSSQLALVNSSNDKEAEELGQKAPKAPIGAANVTGDNRLEIIYVDDDGYLNYRTLDGETSSLKDADGNQISADEGAGISGGATIVSDSSADTTKPTVNISEPTDRKTYNSSNVPLNASADEEDVNWSYTLNDNETQTFSSNTTLTGLDDGDYEVTVYAEDDSGNVGESTVTFTVDTTAPTITFFDPANETTYDSSNVPLEVSADEDVSGWNYSLDNGTNQTFVSSTTLTNLSDGEHTVTVYAEDDGGNVGTETSTFTVDTPADTTDTDGDGIPDSEEGDGDVDGDGTPNDEDEDADGDGIPDSEEGTDDTDGDGTPDYKDGDSDGDGIPDAEEGTGDADDDGTPNYTDGDADGDGIPDSEESTGDTDGDGTPDYQDGDSDGDGVPDSEEGTGDTDGDGVPDYLDEDADGSADDDDGSSGGSDGSSDTDGTGDGMSGENGTDTEPPGNGTSNDEDTDTDGDGIPDAEEGDGDLDGDGTPNDEDPDTDGDGIPDAEEGDGDVDGDGTPNYKDTDTDGDGVPDAEEGTDDTDGDGTPDYRDTDADGDGIPDSADAQRLERNDQYTVIDASLSQTEVTPGEEIEVVVEVENTAEERGEFVLQVRNDGALEKTERFTLPANATTTVRVPYRVTEPGNHTIEANRILAGTVQAEAVEEEESTGVLSGGGGALPVFVLLLLMGIVLTLVGLARHRDRSDS